MPDRPPPAGPPAEEEPVIRLEGVTKRYRGQRAPAVDDLWLEVPRGRIVVIVGPSGCGKTTTLRLINRLITPDAGCIFVEGEDVAQADPDDLRRRMGYVIQQIGLFPHMTVADNVAAVPRMLRWDRWRIDGRVDELLELMGMDPAVYRGRFPRELSGGERQRIGVARALAADPAVLLMDEPFASIDPVNRARLQDELLEIQAEVRKTILFVTHDVGEATKMGDRIAVMDLGARLAQYDAPDRVLAAPAEPFVEEFVGAGTALRALTLTRVGDVEPARWPLVELSTDRSRVREEILTAGREPALLVDQHGRPQRWVTVGDLERGYGALTEAGTPAGPVVGPEDTLHDALNVMVGSRTGMAVAVDADGRYRGVIDLPVVAAVVERLRSGASEREPPGKRVPAVLLRGVGDGD